MKTALLLVLALAASLTIAPYRASGCPPGLLASSAGQQGPPSSPPTGPPTTEPVDMHAQPPRPPADFQGPQLQVTPQRRFDPVRTRKDAEELAALANKIPGQVDQLSKGLLPKDLAQQLKEIEKVAKRLRGEIAP